MYWSEVAPILDANIVQEYGEYLSTVLRTQYNPLHLIEPKPELTDAFLTAVTVSANDWIRYQTIFPCVDSASLALCWLLRNAPHHPAFSCMPAHREHIAVALDRIGNSTYSWCIYPSAVYGFVLFGVNKHETRPDNPYLFDTREFDPEELVAPKRAFSSLTNDQVLTLRKCLLSVFEDAFRIVCTVRDRPNVRIPSYHADAIHKTVERLLSVVHSFPYPLSERR
jgi:hypothetical protein